MNAEERAVAIRQEYERWDAEDIAANPPPSEDKESGRLSAKLDELDTYEMNDELAGQRAQVEAEMLAAADAERDAEDAYGQAREERWAARRAEFVASLEPAPARRGRK